MTACVKVRKRGQRSWTDEQRAAQSAKLRALKPWLKATGPKTVQGKKIVALNALKHGMRSAKTLEFKRYLRWQRGYLARAVVAFKRRRFLLKLRDFCTKKMVEIKTVPLEFDMTPHDLIGSRSSYG